ncbi:MAG: hypothetical protein ACO3T7_08765 [Pseudomonadales bacterium]|jgi:uncharacterized integral membrane protein
MHWVKSFIARLALLALGVVAFVLATENSDPVVLRLLEFESEAWPISWWIVISFFVGVLVDQVLSSASRWLSRK